MRISLKVLTTMVIAIALTAVAQASVINISLPTDANKILLGNNDSAHTCFYLLQSRVSLYNMYNGTNLLTPTMTGCFNGSSKTVNLTGFNYAVVQYDRGAGAQSHSGDTAFFYLNGMTGNYTFSANELGRISSIRLFSANGVPVPEDGASAMLLGVAGLGLVTARRFVRA